MDTFLVSCLFQNVEDNLELIFSIIYGPNYDRARNGLTSDQIEKGFGSNFNVLRFPNE